MQGLTHSVTGQSRTMPNVTQKPWHDGLTGVHRAIAEVTDSPLRVLAGPGTGKTFALTRRVARLLQEGEQPARIFVCTFTRTAAIDLEEELAKLGVDGVDSVRAGTLHSFCFELLHREDVLDLTGRVPRPLLAFEERFMVQDLGTALNLNIRPCEKRVDAFNAAWARLQDQEPGWATDPADKLFEDRLDQWLRFHGTMLVGEMAPLALRFLRTNPHADALGQFGHVLVDEYQDLNRCEQELIRYLAAQGALTVIGDEDQSIYSFKHAHPEGIAQFRNSNPTTHDERLEECRRCPKLVVELAHSLISHNQGRTPRAFRPDPSKADGEVRIVQWASMTDEAEGIADFIKARVVAERVSPGKTLVLAPTRQFGYAIRDKLNASGVDAHSFFHEEALHGDPKDIDDCKAQEAFTLLPLLADPDDRVALRAWCGFGSSNLRGGEWSRLRAHCAATGEIPRAALDRIVRKELRLPKTKGIVARYESLVVGTTALSALSGDDLLDAIFPQGEDWAKPLRAIARSQNLGNRDTGAIRDAIRVAVTQPELPSHVEYVRVMSLHKSKGLTADLVVVVGCIEGLIPRVYDGDAEDDRVRSLEEQRRLFYVALTRARESLVLSSVKSLPRKLAFKMGAKVTGGQKTHANTIASRFLSELGPRTPSSQRGSALSGASS